MIKEKQQNVIFLFFRIVVLFLLCFFFCPLAEAADPEIAFTANLLPGDLIFMKGQLGRLFMQYNLNMINGHVGIYIGNLAMAKKYLPAKDRPRLLRILAKHMALYHLAESTPLFIDIYPSRNQSGGNVFVNGIHKAFRSTHKQEWPEARRYMYPITDEQRGKIITFLIEHFGAIFDSKFYTSDRDALWSCWEFCEAAYQYAGLSLIGVCGFEFSDIAEMKGSKLQKLNMVFNHEYSQFLGFILLSFATFPMEKTLYDEEMQSCYACRLTGGSFFHPEKMRDTVILIRRDLGFVKYAAEMKGFIVEQAGPFAHREEAVHYICRHWDPQYQ